MWCVIKCPCSEDSKTPSVVETEDIKKYSHDKNMPVFKVGSSDCYWGMTARVLVKLWNMAEGHRNNKTFYF